MTRTEMPAYDRRPNQATRP